VEEFLSAKTTARGSCSRVAEYKILALLDSVENLNGKR
jgi:hypothetical protein